MSTIDLIFSFVCLKVMDRSFERGSKVFRDLHVEVPLHHVVGPVVLHLGGVELVLPLVDQAQVPRQPALVVLAAHHVAARPGRRGVMITLYHVPPTCRSPSCSPVQRTPK